MSILTKQMDGYLERASWIRKMFETGAALKAEHGADKVFDFSLGNPDVPPPPQVAQTLRELADTATEAFAFGYMPNHGFPWVRQALADKYSAEQGVTLDPEAIVVTCGAAGAINCLFRAVLEPGDEVLCPAPFFVEYGFYAENHQGVLQPVPAKAPSFDLDLEAIQAAIGPRTRVVLLNSPNNPTGCVYPEADLRALADILRAKSAAYGKAIILAADEPYRFLAYGVEVPALMPLYEHTVVMSSFSKNLSLAGERVGYALVHPEMPERGELMAGLILANRILGFVNAPAIGQVLAAKCLDAAVDVEVYAARKAAMAEVLDAAGYDYAMPGGAFYFFPRVPEQFGGDDVAFCARLQEELILAVPGRGFGMPGYFRLTFCVDESAIRGAAEGFKRAVG